MDLVLGLGLSGAAMVRWLVAHGLSVRAADTRAAPPEKEALIAECPGVEWRFGCVMDAALLDGVDRVWVSPGLPTDLPCLVAARACGLSTGGELALFAEVRRARGDRAPILAITGTNGKSTTTALVSHLLTALGWDAPPLGNIGKPLLAEALERERTGRPWPQVWVVELSSFQLEAAGTFAADAATILNVTEDHLDRHGSMAAYVRAKARILEGAACAVLPRDDATLWQWLGDAAQRVRTVMFGLDQPPTDEDWGVVESEGRSWLAWGDRLLVPTDRLALLGRHNQRNVLAALALVVHLTGWDDRLAAAVTSFRGLPHRMVLVATRSDGVRFVEDSKGTNVGATVAAITSLDAPIRLLAGGDGKGQSFVPLAEAARGRVRCAYLYGRDRTALAEAFTAAGVAVHCCESLEEATARAARDAEPGDIVLLSPACASWDQFRDYRARAACFVAAVERHLTTEQIP
ncbi:UDP-N-acetylmuramoyl-L-alanine--D-glutamate ligase [Hydrogenophilus thermoluteolus]|nr:UDP-N-acetylmuramoyl-L-alanine--D-glutamate ligase [Hydrogenophilus thermoluteolus]MBW7656797.1 UDP-N-acetylmuramoyl-L-alanine--D-glutamate ligase [Hydrogenophilus thermoluteolus]